MKYYLREDGKITGAFTVDQAHMILEKLPDDDPDVLAFLNPVESLDERKRKFYEANGAAEGEFIRALIQERYDADGGAALATFGSKRTAAKANPEFPK